MFSGIPVEQLTAPALTGIAVLMVFMGFLVPKRFYQAKVDESQRWQLAFELQRDRADKSDAQTAELLEVAKTTHALITAVFSNSSAIRQAGEQNVVS